MFSLYEITNPNSGKDMHNKITEGPRGKLGPLMQQMHESNRMSVKISSRATKCKYALYDINGNLVSLTGA